MNPEGKIDFENEAKLLYGIYTPINKDHPLGITPILALLKNLAAQVEEETIQRCQTQQSFNQQVSKIERIYKGKA